MIHRLYRLINLHEHSFFFYVKYKDKSNIQILNLEKKNIKLNLTFEF